MRYKFVSLFLFIFFFVSNTKGQSVFLKKIFTVDYDTNYISTYLTDYTARLFSSVKYGNMEYDDDLVGKRLEYEPNDKLLLGIGVNHGILGLNIGFNFPFVNQDDEIYGKTKYYDFTMRVFSPRFNATIYLQKYKGYYLSNTEDHFPGWQEGDPYYIREDIRSRTIGLDLSYFFNSSKFSYRAAILQNEWQKKSSGSLLIGGSLFYNSVKGDSSIVPSQVSNGLFYNDLKFDLSSNFSMGPSIGYAYTVVIRRHYFIMGSLNGSANIGFTQLQLVNNEEKVKSGLVLGVRSEFLFSTGYNSDRWYFGISFIDLSIITQAPINERTISYNTGMVRFNMVRRFATKKPVRWLNPGVKK